MKIRRLTIYRTGPDRKQACLLGFGLAHGYFIVPELDATRLQTMVTIGLWWIVIRFCLWRQL